MAFHIVTSRCFLACEKVTSVIIEELVEEKAKAKKLSKKTKEKLKKPAKVPETPSMFCISISYYALSMSSPNNNYKSSEPQENTLEVRVLGREKATTLYAEIIKEVQEQHPGEGYLDQLVSKILNGDEFNFPKEEDVNAV